MLLAASKISLTTEDCAVTFRNGNGHRKEKQSSYQTDYLGGPALHYKFHEVKYQGVVAW